MENTYDWLMKITNDGKVPQKPQTREVLHNSSSSANIEQTNPQSSPQTTHSVENVEKFIDEMKTQDAKIKKSIANKKYYEAHKRLKSNVAIFGDGFICGAPQKVKIVKFILKNAQKDGKFALKQKEVIEILKVSKQTITDAYKLLKTIKFWRKDNNGAWIIDKKFLSL